MDRKKLFCICLLGGLAFGILFFVFFGLESGYSWILADISLGGGLAFGMLFFLVWLLVQKHSKPVSFENKKAQAKLQENENTFYGNLRGSFPLSFFSGKGSKKRYVKRRCTYFPTR